MSRQAKANPFWDRVSFAAYACVGALGCAATWYVGRRFYYSYLRRDGNTMWVEETVRDHMREHPKLSVAALKMTAHHVFADSKQPFGAPMLAPPELKRDAEEILDFLKTVQEKEPQVSMADLWVLASVYALSGLGGPQTTFKWGNREASGDVLEIAPSKVLESSYDALPAKKLLVSQGFAMQDIAALMGHRTVGYHVTSLQPGEARRKCTIDEFVFDNDYFINLIENGPWVEPEVSKKAAAKRRKSGGFSWLWGGGKSKQQQMDQQQDSGENHYLLSSHPEMAKMAMQPIDKALSEDPLIRGWMQKYAENEIKFFLAFAELITKIHTRGYIETDL